MEIDFELVIEVKTIHVTTGGQKWIEDAVDGVNGDGITRGEH